MFYETAKRNHGLAKDPFKAIVMPRPIGWISTIGLDGSANLAPYSFFNAFSEEPFYVAFGSGPRKDSLHNIEATGEFAMVLGQDDMLGDGMIRRYVDALAQSPDAVACSSGLPAPRATSTPGS